MVLVSLNLMPYINLLLFLHAEAYQPKIFQAGGLDVIYELLIALASYNVDTIVAATAALKNISIHQGSEVSV